MFQYVKQSHHVERTAVKAGASGCLQINVIQAAFLAKLNRLRCTVQTPGPTKLSKDLDILASPAANIQDSGPLRLYVLGEQLQTGAPFGKMPPVFFFEIVQILVKIRVHSDFPSP